MNFSIIILAAGLGKRMNNPNEAKVLAKLNGLPLIHYVFQTAISLNPDKICIVVGHQKEMLISYIEEHILNLFPFQNIEYVVQTEQLGTGHAVKCCENNFKEYTGKILILSGDVPLLTRETLSNFIENSKETDLSVMTSIASAPSGYGRILRDNDGNIIAIKEEKDTSDWERLINEINAGIYIVGSNLLFSLLEKVENKNNVGEYYLTDIISIGLTEKKRVVANTIVNLSEVEGINTMEQLQKIRNFLSKKETQ